MDRPTRRAPVVLALAFVTALAGCGAGEVELSTPPPARTADAPTAVAASNPPGGETTARLGPGADCGLGATGTSEPVWNPQPAVFVEFAGLPYHMRFWAAAGEASYYTSGGIGFGNEWAETEEDSEIFEVAYDHDSFMWIDTQHPARVTVRYRGALKDVTSTVIAHDDVPSGSPWGPGDWAEEVWRIYPDGVSARTVTIYTGHAADAMAYWGGDGVIFETQETFIYAEDPETQISADPLTLAKMDGTYERISFSPYPPEVSLSPGANIQLVNLAGGPYPFTIVPDGDVQISAYPGPPPAPATFVAWPHEDLDGDEVPDNYRVALSHVIPWQFYARSANTLTQVFLTGIIEDPGGEAARVGHAVTTARAWLRAPELTVVSGGLTTSGYDVTERAYTLKAAATPERAVITLAGSADRPVHNPAFVIRGAGAVRSLDLEVDGAPHADYCLGTEGDDLVVWVRLGSEEEVTLAFEFGTIADAIYVLGGAGAVGDAVSGAIGDAVAASPTRLAGADRFATAGAIAAEFFPTADTVFIATGTNFPDALAVGPVAARTGAPVLLATAGVLPGATRTELTRLAPATVVIIGGAAAVGDAVAAELAGYAGSVLRLAGPDRYRTAVAVSQYGFPAGAAVVYLATGDNFPDALSAGAAAARENGPVLLTPSATLPGHVLAEILRLEPVTVMVVGGDAVVSPAVVAAVEAAGFTVVRRSGADRYATSAAISAGSFSVGGRAILFATGDNFPDALAGVPAAGISGAPILLVRPDALPAVIRAEAQRLVE